MGTFGVKKASDEYFCPSTVLYSGRDEKIGKLVVAKQGIGG